MTSPKKPKVYREMIDALVEVCRAGQGQIGANRVRAGVWNQNATADFIPEQHQINMLLARLPQDDRDVMASMLAEAVVTGVFEALKVLEEFEVAPFIDGYEGSPFHDFVGRLDDWEWPEAQ